MDSAAKNSNANASRDVAALPIYAYFGALSLLIYLATPTGYLVDIATAFMLKNQLHRTPNEVANFRLFTALPAVFALVFGMIRDRWNPLGLRDRGYFLLFAPATAAIFLILAFAKLQYEMLALGMILVMISFAFITAAYQGLMSLIGQEKLMSGRLSTLWNIGLSLPSLLAAWSAGWVTVHLTYQHIFILIALLSVALMLVGFWKPTEIFRGAYNQPQAKHQDLRSDLKRLFAHRAIYPAIGINFLFNFSPGSTTPLQYYLTNNLHLSDDVFSNYTAIFAGSFIPVFVLYGFLCKRVNLRTLLIWGTIITIPQMIPLMFVNSAQSAQLLAIPIGLMGGIAAAAYSDLAIRSCPAGLQGTLMMAVSGVLILSSRAGDLIGTMLFEFGHDRGFLYCVVATTIVYALMLPLIWTIPRNLIDTRDAEENPELLGENSESPASA